MLWRGYWKANASRLWSKQYERKGIVLVVGTLRRWKNMKFCLLLVSWPWKCKSRSCVWLFATPWTTQSMEFSRPEYWSGELFPSSGIELGSPALQVNSLPTELSGKPVALIDLRLGGRGRDIFIHLPFFCAAYKLFVGLHELEGCYWCSPERWSSWLGWA